MASEYNNGLNVVFSLETNWCDIFLFKQSLAILGCVAISLYVSEQMWDFMTDTKSLFKDDIRSCTEAKFIVPEYYETAPKMMWNSNEKILWNSANNNTLKVDFIP